MSVLPKFKDDSIYVIPCNDGSGRAQAQQQEQQQRLVDEIASTDNSFVGSNNENIRDDDDDDNDDYYNDNERVFRLNSVKLPTRWILLLRYVLLASIAITVTLTCPGNTKLWMENTTVTNHSNNNNSNDNFVLNNNVVVQVLVIYMITLIGFIVVHYSNPGFLTKEIMDEVQDYDNIDDFEQQQLTLLATTTNNKKEQCTMIEMTNINEHNADDFECTDDTNNLLCNTMNGTQRNNNTQTRRMKFCATCQIQPLIRSHHCKICQHCVATFDHHCYFMGVCIGERNHLRFYCFLFIQAIGFYICSTIVGSSNLGWTTIVLPNHSLVTNANIYYNAIRVIVAKLYLYPLTLIAWIMLGIHTFFALTNITTFECAKGPKHIDYLHNIHDIMDLPFHRGFVQNVKYCCTSDDIWYSNCYCRNGNDRWKPTIWKKPGYIVHDSPDWWNHPWRNKYWSCC
jgi:DHHC palmitoyltransferase